MPNKRTHPIHFQGSLDKTNYFEGWYYKQVSADQKTSLSFIPGVSLNADDAHSFIQYILAETNDSGHTTTITGYIRFPLDSFAYDDNPFSVIIGDNHFSEKGFELRFEDERFSVAGRIQLGQLQPIQRSLLQPNIMGIFAYMPGMECNHGVISMNHTLDGTLTINGREIDFTGGKGYIEKDWGRSFPKHYIWLQSNHFADKDTSLFFSIAHIPFVGQAFEGFICNFIHAGEEYRFATYNLSHCKIETLTNQNVRLSLENRRARLTIEAAVSQQAELIAPLHGTMQKTIKEGISGTLTVTLQNKQSGLTYEGIGENAGIEIVGMT